MQYLERVTWHQYVHTIAAGDTNVAISKRTGIGPSTISRWGQPKPHDVVAFARGYQQPVLEALVASGLITAEEAHATVNIEIIQPAEIDNAALLGMLAERLGVYLSTPPETITSPDQYGKDPKPDDFDLAAGTIRRPDDTWAE